ncbi:flagellar assembly protein FliW, partial [Escherichia coli]|uniref:flagellar assembly protein FliW n=1 Tax=Escherichia coli TaxID=562 RepID=UPI0028DDB94E
LPVRTIKPDFEVALSEEERAVLGVADCVRPEIGTDLICLALLFPANAGLEANLGAPIVINLHNLRCVQSCNESAPRHYRLNGEGHWEPVC